ncbi:MAG: beta-galactosidase [Sandaracinaceae bacterium]
MGKRDVPLLSGAMHYWRLEREAWRTGLMQLKGLGLPIVETYVPWQVHELAPGEFDFGRIDPQKDVAAFVDLAHELELIVFVRPGPHINAEMTYFGLPERIVYDRACQARSPRQNPVLQGFPPRMFPVPSYASATFLSEVARWFEAVGAQLASRVWPAGPIAMVQVDNEASFYFRDAIYETDYHPDAIEGWQTFLGTRYGTLAKTAAAHRATYARWKDVAPPVRFRAEKPEELTIHLDWAAYHEALIEGALGAMKRSLADAGLGEVVTVHNLPLGEQGTPLSSPAIERTLDLVGYDYYHARREHRAIKRRTLTLAGTHPVPYSPELGIGAPAWFTPLSNEDSLFTAMCALAYGLRGFNLYMAVDRDRWYGAPIDTRGNPRLEASPWKMLLGRLQQTGFHTLSRRVEVGLMLPREYARLSRATSLLGFLSPTVLEATTGNPVLACREDDFGFTGPIQVLWWKMIARFADALTQRGIPYVYVDSDADPSRLEGLRALIAPSFEIGDPERWRKVTAFGERGGTVVYGPAMPSLDTASNRTLFEVPPRSRRVLIDRPEDALAVVDELIKRVELARPFPIEPAPLETAVHEDGTGPRVLFVINPGKAAATGVIALEGELELEDLMNGERFRGEDQLTIPMRGWSCRMLGVVRTADSDESRVGAAS